MVTLLGLYDLCRYYIDHRLAVITRRTEYRLRRARERAHIVEGLLIALDNIDEVIRIIRASQDVPEARTKLMSQLRLSEVQASHILDMQLRRLTALEVEKLRAELDQLHHAIAGYETLLGSDQRKRTLLNSELAEVAEQFGGPRRTKIMNADDIVVIEEVPTKTSIDDAIADADTPTIVTLSTSGLLGRLAADEEFSAKPGRHDVLVRFVETTSYASIYAVTDRGRLLSVRVRDIPEMVRGSRGASVTEMFSLSRGERVVGLTGRPEGPVAIVTRSGTAKRLAPDTVTSTRNGNPVIGLKDNDRVVSAFSAPDGSEFAMIASDGQVLRTPADSISMQGAGAGGVAGMKLRPGSEVVAAGSVEFGTVVVAITDEGTAKITDTAEIPAKGRATGGVRILKFKGFETTVAYGWMGKNRQLAAIVADPGDVKKTDPTPVPLLLETTPRDRTSTDLGVSIAAIGEYRFS